MTIHQKIGGQIREARTQANLTQKEMGSLLGRSGAAIAYLEQGKRKVGPDILQRIAQVTRKPLSFFYEDQISTDTRLQEQLSALKFQLEEIRDVLEQEEKKRFRIEEELLASEQKFRSLFEGAADAMLLMDLDGKILDVNQRYCQLLGMLRADLVDRSFWDIPFAPGDQMPHFKKAFLQAVKSGMVVESARHPFYNAKRELIQVESTSRFLEQDGKLWAMVCSIRLVGSSPNLYEL